MLGEFLKKLSLTLSELKKKNYWIVCFLGCVTALHNNESKAPPGRLDGLKTRQKRLEWTTSD